MKDEIEKETAEVCKELPKQPPEGTIETLLNRGAFQHDVLLYRAGMAYIPLEDRRRKMVLVHCTACGEETYLEYEQIKSECSYGCKDPFGFIDPMDNELKKSNSTCLCPNCDKGVTAQHITHVGKDYIIEEQCCATVHNIRGHLAVLLWSITKNTDKLGAIHYESRRWEGIVIIDGKPTRWTGYTRNMGKSIRFHGWEYRKKFYENLGECEKNRLIPFDPAIINDTGSANSAFYEYLNDGVVKDAVYPGAYLQTWAKYPQIENLIRQGCAKLVTEMLSEATGYHSNYTRMTFQISQFDRYIDWKQVKPAAMLRLTKEEYHIVKEKSLEALWFYTEVKKSRGIKLCNNDLESAHKIGVMNLWELIKDNQNGYSVPVLKLIHYLQKQKALTNSTFQKGLITPRYLKDYWDALYKVNQSMVPSLLYPKDLIKAHDDMILRVKEKEDAALNQQIIRRLAELEELSFIDESLGLLIRPCASHGELINEGKLLHHCVGGYAKDYANGKTSIFFIRKTDAPETPLFTLEWRDGEAHQNRGDHNCDRTPEVVAFEAEWLDYVKQIQKKKEKKEKKENAKRSRAKQP